MKKLSYLFVTICFLLNACSENQTPNECVSFVESGVEAVALIPTIDMIGATFKVDFGISNGCG